MANVIVAFRGIDHPWPVLPRRAMAHVLRVRTFEVRHPVSEFILMKADNLASCHGMRGFTLPIAECRQAPSGVARRTTQ